MLLLKPKYNLGEVEYRIKGMPFRDVEPSIIRIKYIHDRAESTIDVVSKFGTNTIDTKILEWMDTSIISDITDTKINIPSYVTTISHINFVNVNVRLILCNGIIFYTNSKRKLFLSSNNALEHFNFGATFFMDSNNKEHLVIDPSLPTGIKNLIIKLYRVRLSNKNSKPSIMLVNINKLAKITVNPQLILSTSIKKSLIDLIKSGGVSDTNIVKLMKSQYNLGYLAVYGFPNEPIPTNEILFK